MGTRLPVRAVLAFGGVVLLPWGCGGNVVVDDVSTSAGGNTTSLTTTSGSGFTCDLQCGGPAGLCGCSGSCSDGNMRASACGGSEATGFSCTCSVNQQVVGMCSQSSVACDLPGSCCEAIFGG
jgi:hypothetical protein